MRIERFYSEDANIEDSHFILSYYPEHFSGVLTGVVKNYDKRKIRVEVKIYKTGNFINITQFTNKPVIPYTFKGPQEMGEYYDIVIKIVDENKNILLNDTFANPLLIGRYWINMHESENNHLTSVPLEYYISNLTQNFLEINGSTTIEAKNPYYQIDNNAQEKFEATES